MVKWSAHWCFWILSYAHWDIQRNGVSVCMCITNAEDRSAKWIRYDDCPPNVKTPEMPFRQTLMWIEQHQGEAFPSRRT